MSMLNKEKFKLLLLYLSLFLLLGFISSCTTVDITVPSNKKQSVTKQIKTDLLTEATLALNKGRYKEASKKYEVFLKENSSLDKIDSVWLAYGLSSEKAGLIDNAIYAYENLQNKFPKNIFLKEVQTRLAILYLNKKEYDKALNLAQNQYNKTTGEEKARWADLIGRSYLGKQNPNLAFDSFLNYYDLTANKTEVESSLKESLQSMDINALQAIKTRPKANFIKPQVIYILIYRYLENGDKNNAQKEADYFYQQYPKHNLAVKVKELFSSLKLPILSSDFVIIPSPLKKDEPAFLGLSTEGIVSKINPGAILNKREKINIVAILPLSSHSSAQYGQGVLKGLQLAIITYKFSNSGVKIGLLAKDSKGDPVLAEKLVEESAKEDDILLIVGPLTALEAPAAAQKAQNLQMPMIAISQKSQLTKIGDYIFRIYLSPEHQARAMAKYAVDDLKIKDLAIIYSQDAFGRGMRASFIEEVKKQGGSISREIIYDYKNPDFAAIATTLESLKDKTSIYIPDSANFAAKLASYLPKGKKLNLLGASSWANNSLLSNGGANFEDSIFPVAFTALFSTTPKAKSFTSLFRESYQGLTPDQLEAYGYDAGLVALKVLDKKRNDRQNVKKSLSTIKNFSGVTGPFSFDKEGDYNISPTLITIKNSSFIMLKAAEKSDD